VTPGRARRYEVKAFYSHRERPETPRRGQARRNGGALDANVLPERA